MASNEVKTVSNSNLVAQGVIVIGLMVLYMREQVMCLEALILST